MGSSPTYASIWKKMQLSCPELLLANEMKSRSLGGGSAIMVCKYRSVVNNMNYYCLTSDDSVEVDCFLEYLDELILEYFDKDEVSVKKLVNNFDRLSLLLHSVVNGGEINVGFLYNNRIQNVVPPVHDLRKILNETAHTIMNQSSGAMRSAGSGVAFNASSSSRGEDMVVPWRRNGIKDAKEELYVDLKEEVYVTYRKSDRHHGRDGIRTSNPSMELVSGHIKGTIDVRCYLNGNPTVSLMFDTMGNDLGIPSFHACVEQEDQVQEQKQEQEPESFQGKRLLRFLPPDGKFRLAQYVIDLDGQGGMSRRMDRDGLIQVSFEDGLGLNKDEFEVRLHVRESIAVVDPVEDLVVTLQFSNGNDSNVKMLRATHGTFVGQDEDRQCSWRFDSDEISAGTLPVLRGCIDDSKHVQQKKRSCLTSVAVRYGYPGELASGCRVTRLDVDVASPRVRGKVFKGVRCVTRVPALTVRA